MSWRGINMLKYNITKKFLQQEYIINKKSTTEIAKELNCGHSTIANRLKKYNIKTRTISENNIGKGNPAFVDGRTLIKHFCIDCKKEICYQTALYSGKKCSHCARPKKKYYCKLCGKEIGYWGAHYGLGICKYCVNKGDRNPNFKDGRTSLQVSIRNLFEHKQWRKQVFKRDDFECQECNQIGGKLEAHHKIAFAKLLQEFLQEYNQFSPIEDKETLVRLAMKWQPFWNIDNGVTLCEDCHKNVKKR